MKASKKCIEAIKKFEGLRLYAYRCPAGIPTIGYGHTKNVKMGMAITKLKADELLMEDVADVERAINSMKLPKLTQGQFDALVDFGFNLGAYRLTKGSDGHPTTLYNKIVGGYTTEQILAQFRRWVYSNGHKLQGLIDRREWDCQQWVS
jgi:lysozyme